jgi:hypothetical protein
MLTWGAIFADDIETEILVEEAEADSGMLARFDAVAREGYFGPRQIAGTQYRREGHVAAPTNQLDASESIATQED